MIEDLLEAFRFLTVFPLPKERKPDLNALARSMAFFPLAGAAIGALALAAYQLSASYLPLRVAALCLVVVPILLSGGLHLDGFADFCDGFFSGKDRERILAVMKDSRIGAWGTCGIVLVLLAKFELVQVIAPRAPVFLLAMTVSRWAQVAFGYFLPYGGAGGGMGALVAGKISLMRFLIATVFVLPFVFWLRMKGVVIFLLLWPMLALLGFYFKKKIGGMTGDLYGAASEMTELLILMAAAWTA